MFQVTLLLALVSFVLGDFDADLHDKYMTMSREEFIEYFNSQNYNFKIGSAPELHESSTSCVYMDEETFNNLPRIYHSPAVIAAAPESFDARQQWPSCGSISEVYNQGACGSCWTFGTATVASDRTCIGLGVDVRLSEQDFECLTKDVCKGYYPQEAFNFGPPKGWLLKNVSRTTLINSSTIKHVQELVLTEVLMKVTNIMVPQFTLWLVMMAK
ncbi:cathepsin B-like [Manduca sexta]|uniref:cathepsin B-like n=1 Tax=Manduca sexta TaxID=7130 RepID=UPI00189051F7|nr:cathepsin B-like [Manduca sexta]